MKKNYNTNTQHSDDFRLQTAGTVCTTDTSAGAAGQT